MMADDVFPSTAITLFVSGRTTLRGTIHVAGSKNAFHKLVAAAVLVEGVHTLRRVPGSGDAEALIGMVEMLGGKVSWNKPQRILTVDSRSVTPAALMPDVTTRSTGSFLFAGALLARFKEAFVGPPGGDQIGARPVDRHLGAFESLGATVAYSDGAYEIAAPHLKAAEVVFTKDTVNGTANAIMAAVGAQGVTHIRGGSIDPDVLALVDFLRQAGFRITLEGTDITIQGRVRLPAADVDFTVPVDRNDAATLVIAGALAGDNLRISEALGAMLDPLLNALQAAGCGVLIEEEDIVVSRPHSGRALDIETAPFPGFSTDWGPMIHVLLSQLVGTSQFHEQVYSDRFSHLLQLRKMGLVVTFVNDRDGAYEFGEESRRGQVAVINGPTRLHAAKVEAENLRAAAALLLAGLIAVGTTEVTNANHVLRGYDDLVGRLVRAGANIRIETS